MSDSCQHLFVYGTLRRGMNADIEKILPGKVKWIATAAATGKLFDLGQYPGMVESQNISNRVIGDVYFLEDGPYVLKMLDHYEDATEDDRFALYQRKQQPIQIADQPNMIAWIYIYNQTVFGKKRIPNGDYCSYLYQSDS